MDEAKPGGCLLRLSVNAWPDRFKVITIRGKHEGEGRQLTLTAAEKRSLEWEILRIPGYNPHIGAEDYYFDHEEAMRPLDFFPRYIRHVKGSLARKPYHLSWWERAVAANLWGWRHRKTGFRRYREGLVYVPRKNSKTTFIAGFSGFDLMCDPEEGKEIYSAAYEKDQASIIFNILRQMVLLSTPLKKRLRIYKAARSIGHDDTFSTYRAICADDKSAHGHNPSLAIVDELHNQRDGRLIEALETGQGARDEPLLLSITTADYDREGSICNDKYSYAVAVRDGTLPEPDPSFLPVIFEADPKVDDWKDRRSWYKANPNLGASVRLEYMEKKFKKALISLEDRGSFKRLHLNIRTTTKTRWLPVALWDRCFDPAFSLEALEDERCYGGLDLSSNIDLTAFVLIFPDRGNAVLPFFWVPAETARDRQIKEKNIPYERWSDEGLIEVTEGNAIDQGRIRESINELGRRFRILEIGYDPNDASWIAGKLQDDDGFQVYKYPQSHATMNEPIKELETLLMKENLRHGGNACMRWNFGNVAVEKNRKEEKMFKKFSDKNRIDGMVALAMATGRMLLSDARESVYETRGIRSVSEIAQGGS